MDSRKNKGALAAPVYVAHRAVVVRTKDNTTSPPKLRRTIAPAIQVEAIYHDVRTPLKAGSRAK
jgi:hypothetical protein